MIFSMMFIVIQKVLYEGTKKGLNKKKPLLSTG